MFVSPIEDEPSKEETVKRFYDFESSNQLIHAYELMLYLKVVDKKGTSKWIKQLSPIARIVSSVGSNRMSVLRREQSHEVPFPRKQQAKLPVFSPHLLFCAESQAMNVTTTRVVYASLTSYRPKPGINWFALQIDASNGVDKIISMKTMKLKKNKLLVFLFARRN